MADNSKTKFLLGLAIVIALKILYKVVRATIKALANIIVFFGLYIPFFYGVYGVCMILWGGLNLDVVCLETTLFYIGFALSCACSVVITIRSRIGGALSGVFSSFKEETFPSYEEERRKWLRSHGDDPTARRYQTDEQAPVAYQTASAGNGYTQSYSAYNTGNGGNYGTVQTEGQPPLLREPYYSEQEPDVLVYDYADFVDYYRLDGEGVPRFTERRVK